MKSIEDTSATLVSLKSMGIQTLVDDFGVGHFRLRDLKELPLDAMKIDQSFIRDISFDGENILVNAIIGIGRMLRHDVIAKGVETEAQLSFLRQHHCDAAQGLYIHAPMHAEDFAVFLEDTKPSLH